MKEDRSWYIFEGSTSDVIQKYYLSMPPVAIHIYIYIYIYIYIWKVNNKIANPKIAKVPNNWIQKMIFNQMILKMNDFSISVYYLTNIPKTLICKWVSETVERTILKLFKKLEYMFQWLSSNAMVPCASSVRLIG